jgi:hypothetical protein
MYEMNTQTIEDWLHNPHAVHVTYPNVAKRLVQWMLDGTPKMDADFIESIWDGVEVLQVKH